ncbi:neuferricin [Ostrinia nubilalis]|uniref:neuferricin n=1 Tax=Ostrinia nubilalis TaxID=29057 RepID=UPI0030825584
MSRLVNLVISLCVVLTGILVKDKLDGYLRKKNVTIRNNGSYDLLTPEDLALYNGQDQRELYLALVGYIFDVSEATKHYGKGSSYHYFVGKDGSRAFITGDFKDEGPEKDHVLDLTCDELLVLLNWIKTFKEKYKHVGFVIGTYFDQEGYPTEYNKLFIEKVDNCKVQKEIEKQRNIKYPPCNISWSAENGSKVWCTTSSGGINRTWTGVPRQLYTPGEEKPRCVCINMADSDTTAGMYREYDNCPKSSTSCVIDSES